MVAAQAGQYPLPPTPGAQQQRPRGLGLVAVAGAVARPMLYSITGVLVAIANTVEPLGRSTRNMVFMRSPPTVRDSKLALVSPKASA